MDLAGGIIAFAILLLFVGLPVFAGLWLYARLDGNTKTSRERLIAAADRLREQQDEDTNRGT
ncbi:MAG: hypothetical protein R3B98_07340 [Hyphomonas sp.]